MRSALWQPRFVHDLAVEQRLLLRLVRRAAGALELGPEELAILEAGERQEAFFSLAARHGVQGTVLWRLAHPGDPPAVPGALVERARGTLRALRSEAVLWDLERDRVIACLVARGLTPVALKGAALRQTVYADPVQRSLADIDLLLAISWVAVIVVLLTQLISDIGYAYLNPRIRVS